MSFFDVNSMKGDGIYCIYPFDNFDANGKGVFKIGMTKDGRNRIKGYHTSLPLGVYGKCYLEKPIIKNMLNKDALKLIEKKSSTILFVLVVYGSEHRNGFFVTNI